MRGNTQSDGMKEINFDYTDHNVRAVLWNSSRGIPGHELSTELLQHCQHRLPLLVVRLLCTLATLQGQKIICQLLDAWVLIHDYTFGFISIIRDQWSSVKRKD